jgi:hypothetical protein
VSQLLLASIFLSFLLIWQRGGGSAGGEWGRVQGPSQQFLHAFWQTASDPTRGRGHWQTNPLPPGCNHHQNVHHARSYSVKYIFLKYPVLSIVFTHALGERRAIRRGGGGALTPSSQAEITIKTPIMRAPTHLLKSPKLAVGSQPRPPPTRTRRTPPTFVCSVTSECLF